MNNASLFSRASFCKEKMARFANTRVLLVVSLQQKELERKNLDLQAIIDNLTVRGGKKRKQTERSVFHIAPRSVLGKARRAIYFIGRVLLFVSFFFSLCPKRCFVGQADVEALKNYQHINNSDGNSSSSSSSGSNVSHAGSGGNGINGHDTGLGESLASSSVDDNIQRRRTYKVRNYFVR